MSELGSKTALVFDHGIFTEFAIRLSKDFGKVYYHCPWQYGFSHLNDAMVGQGFDEIEWCDDPYDPDIIKEVDVFCFPDIQHSGSQLLLEQLGKRVWGSRKADTLELLRENFKRVQKKIGMPVPKHYTVEGMDELRKFLKDHDDVYVKISRYRGSMETFHHIDMALSDAKLDQLSAEFGAAKNQVPFLIEEPIPTSVEVGFDGYCIDGKFPSVAVHGLEIKDQAYIGTIQKYEEMPESVKEVNEFMSDVLTKFRYRNFWSTEIRVSEDSTPYLIDPTCRHASPAGESQLELYGNLGDIVWSGSNGELVDPEPVSKFAVQCVIEHTGEESDWRTLEIPDDIRQWVKLRYACKIDGRYHIVPQPAPHDPNIGWVLGIGDTIQEAIDHAKEVSEELEGQNLTIHTETLVDVIKAVESEEEEGIEFTKQEIPEIESLV